jgi:hypothetical protein
MRDLHQDSGAVTCFVVRAFGPAVFHPFQHLDAAINNIVRRISFDMRYKSDPARVVLVCAAIKSSLFWQLL